MEGGRAQQAYKDTQDLGAHHISLGSTALGSFLNRIPPLGLAFDTKEDLSTIHFSSLNFGFFIYKYIISRQMFQKHFEKPRIPFVNKSIYGTLGDQTGNIRTAVVEARVGDPKLILTYPCSPSKYLIRTPEFPRLQCKLTHELR